MGIIVRGDTQYDKFSHETVVMVRDMSACDLPVRMDTAKEKRIELHLHTQMSNMDAVASATALIERAAKWGHEAIAITDHGVAQAFPEAFGAAKKNNIKLLPGVEGYLTDDDQVVTGDCDLPIDTPVIVLDLGTATTMVVVDGNSTYRGGAIMPGVRLGLRALSSGTSLLPDISVTPPPKVIATNTVDAMRSGAVFATASMIDGMIDRMEEELGYKCQVVATGGLSAAVVNSCKHDIILDRNLLLRGLWVLYEKNRK